MLNLKSVQASRLCKAAAVSRLRCNPIASRWLFSIVAWQLWAIQEGSRPVCVKFLDFRLGNSAAIAALTRFQASSQSADNSPTNSSLATVLTILKQTGMGMSSQSAVLVKWSAKAIYYTAYATAARCL